MDAIRVAKLLEPYAGIIGDGDLVSALSHPDNIVLGTDKDIILLMYARPGIYTGHYFLAKRGRDALAFARDCLRQAFEDYPVICIQGLTPVENRAARWFSRQLGFNSQGVLKTGSSDCEFFLLTREEWKRKT